MSRLYHRLQVAASLLKKEADRHLLEVAGLTTAQAAALAVIGDEESTQRLVARRLHVSEPAVATMVERLTEAGLVHRRRSDDDGRVRLLRLSRAGHRALADAQSAFASVNASISDALGADGAAGVERDLERLVRYLASPRDTAVEG